MIFNPLLPVIFPDWSTLTLVFEIDKEVDELVPDKTPLVERSMAAGTVLLSTAEPV